MGGFAMGWPHPRRVPSAFPYADLPRAWPTFPPPSSPSVSVSSLPQVGESGAVGVGVRPGPVCWRCGEDHYHMMEIGVLAEIPDTPQATPDRARSCRIPPEDPSISARIPACLSDILDWMKERHLKLNLAIPAYPSFNHNLTAQLGSTTIKPTRTARNLRVIFDDHLNFPDHISTAQSCRFILYNIKKIRPYLTDHATQLAHVHVISKLDYCNTLLLGLPASSIKPLQMIENATPCFQPAQKDPCHTPLHLPPLASCIRLYQFKAMMLTYKTLSGTAPPYLNTLLEV
ncbi:uncharacterized protein LOC113544300 isoform X2 [Pangasianodon hypophthalmus]|uniref:uncharacterized protein LOC113544300 isoform X2 n=1 Tax=Pangasianodon hypophthalmus TaxID=310915 RepID=UPI0023083508|nr:uncharacterized protein LOC113544300 isoform X2 [Pangasianodon hypophthalmus]